MDELDVLRSLGSDVAAPHLPAKRAARAALLARARAASSRPRWAVWSRLGLRRSGIAAAVAAVALVALVGSGLLPLGAQPDPAAAAALNRAADVAAAQPAGSGVGYRHMKSEGAYLSGIGGDSNHPDGIWALVPVEREIWIGPDGSGRLIESRGEPIWFGPEDEAAWVAAGSPDLLGGQDSDTRFGPTPPGFEPGTPQPWPGSLHYEDLDALPTDVGALRAVIDARAAAGGGATDYGRFTIVGDLLRETVGMPELRAALYRVAAGLGGVELIGSMTDRAGRTGIAVAMTSHQPGRGLERRTLIFDPDTSMLLAEDDVLFERVDWLDADPPLVIGYNTYLVSDIVATIPED
jgi:hypothetical protein